MSASKRFNHKQNRLIELLVAQGKFVERRLEDCNTVEDVDSLLTECERWMKEKVKGNHLNKTEFTTLQQNQFHIRKILSNRKKQLILKSSQTSAKKSDPVGS